MRKRLFETLALLVVATFIVCGLATATTAEELKPITTTWVAGGVGGGWYAQAGGLAPHPTMRIGRAF